MQGQNADLRKYDTETRVAFLSDQLVYNLSIYTYSLSESSNLSFGGR